MRSFLFILATVGILGSSPAISAEPALIVKESKLGVTQTIVALRNGRIVLDTPASDFGEEAFRVVFQPGPALARGDGLAGDQIEDFGAHLDRSLKRA